MVVRAIKNIIDTIIFGGIVVGGTIGFLMLVGVITWL